VAGSPSIGRFARFGTDSDLATSEAPQAPQNFAVGGTSPPQLPHRRASVAPHSSQKRFVAGLSWPHDWQAIVIGGRPRKPRVPSVRVDTRTRYVYTQLCSSGIPGKAARNLKKHGVTFFEAASVFTDPEGLDLPDDAHSAAERRSWRIGMSDEGRVLTVVYAIRRFGDGEAIRIISARAASRKERAAYASRDD
jgi:uncharacterized DUF497 family protein